jgi:hypothetical protein
MTDKPTRRTPSQAAAPDKPGAQQRAAQARPAASGQRRSPIEDELAAALDVLEQRVDSGKRLLAELKPARSKSGR